MTASPFALKNNSSETQHFCRVAMWIMAGLFAVRLVAAALLPLGFDEAYYWLWSKQLAAGYYDHPPMVAFVIWLGTHLAGDTPFGTRVIGILLGVPTTWAIWHAALLLFKNQRLAAEAALYFNFTLAAAVGLVLATPDAPLLMASAFLLFFLAKVIEKGSGPWWLAVGAAVGCALLSKYTAIFFGVGILLWLVSVPEMRKHLLTPWPWLGGILALLIFMPVVLWNQQHEWISFAKQFRRASHYEWRPRFIGEYVAMQMGMLTPPVFILAVMALAAFLNKRGGLMSARILLVALLAPPVIYFLTYATHDRVEGNWLWMEFPAFVISAAAASTLDWKNIAARLVNVMRQIAIPFGLLVMVVAYGQALFAFLPIVPVQVTAQQIGNGWPELAKKINSEIEKNKTWAVITSNYNTTGWLEFYLPPLANVIQINERYRWRNAPLPDAALWKEPLLYVCKAPCPEMESLRAHFFGVKKIAVLPREWNGAIVDAYEIYRVKNWRGALIDPVKPGLRAGEK